MTKEQIMQKIIHALYTGKVIGDKDLMQVLEEAHFKDYAISSIIDKITTNILNTSILKSQLSEAGEENKSSHELQNERMRIWFQKRTGLIDAMLCTHMKKIDEMLSIDPVE